MRRQAPAIRALQVSPTQTIDVAVPARSAAQNTQRQPTQTRQTSTE